MSLSTWWSTRVMHHGRRGAPDGRRLPKAPEWNSARRAYVDDEGRLGLRVNDDDHELDLGTDLASTSVTVLLIGLHVFITVTATGELLRELRLNPDLDFPPE